MAAPENNPFGVSPCRRAFARCALAACLLLCVAVGCRRAEPSPPAALQAPKEIVTPSGIVMVVIPAGEFFMGDDAAEADEKPAHKVRLSAFCMDKCEVTQAAYEKLMGRNPSKFQGSERPVEQVSWHAAMRYCNMRSLQEGLKPCYDPETLQCDFSADGYRLPTEAEWEYACRAGTKTRYSLSSDAAKLPEYAWFKGNSANTTHRVGQKAPNAWGLHDMHGNVAEWCNDFYGESYHAESSSQDPRGPASGEERVLRGGSWRSTEESCRSSVRDSQPPGLADVCFGYEAYGFRCVKKAPQKAPE